MIIKGNKIVIKTTKKEDLKLIQELWNNGEVMKWVGFPKGLNKSIDDVKKWWKNLQNNNLAKHFVVFTRDNEFCGEVFYKKDPDNNRAGLDIKFLPNTQGKGLATESLELLINYIFANEDEIDAVWTEPSEENKAARNLYSRCGLEPKPRPNDMEHAETYWELERKNWKDKL